jgi:hypothetical protein
VGNGVACQQPELCTMGPLMCRRCTSQLGEDGLCVAKGRVGGRGVDLENHTVRFATVAKKTFRYCGETYGNSTCLMFATNKASYLTPEHCTFRRSPGRFHWLVVYCIFSALLRQLAGHPATSQQRVRASPAKIRDTLRHRGPNEGHPTPHPPPSRSRQAKSGQHGLF